MRSLYGYTVREPDVLTLPTSLKSALCALLELHESVTALPAYTEELLALNEHIGLLTGGEATTTAELQVAVPPAPVTVIV